ncbi:MAG: 5-formyltetrahydrofolate cyclo-ligase [Alistipes sp.]|nr:5-formyltetrahydrofolate cyclo-ligase [Alistipes sp.]
MNRESKQKIRHEVKSKVKAISAEQKQPRSALIFSRIASLSAVQEAKTIALYAALPDEPQTAAFIEQLSLTRRIVLPRVEGDDMEFYPYDAEHIERGAFGIAEPQGGEATEPAEIEVMVVPGVAFTREGKRLGRGKGYYDRYLSREGFRATTIGVCYTEQLVEEIPDEPHDIDMDVVIFG